MVEKRIVGGYDDAVAPSSNVMADIVISNFQFGPSEIGKNCPISSSFVLIARKLDLLMQPWRQVWKIQFDQRGRCYKISRLLWISIDDCSMQVACEHFCKSALVLLLIWNEDAFHRTVYQSWVHCSVSIDFSCLWEPYATTTLLFHFLDIFSCKLGRAIYIVHFHRNLQNTLKICKKLWLVVSLEMERYLINPKALHSEVVTLCQGHWLVSKLEEYGWGLEIRQTIVGCIEGALLTSILRHNFEASQAVHDADDITNLNL